MSILPSQNNEKQTGLLEILLSSFHLHGNTLGSLSQTQKSGKSTSRKIKDSFHLKCHTLGFCGPPTQKLKLLVLRSTT